MKHVEMIRIKHTALPYNGATLGETCTGEFNTFSNNTVKHTSQTIN